MFTFDQKTGLFHSYSNDFTAQAYSGFGIHSNNPSSEGLKDLGPIPRGTWSIGFPITHPLLGAFVLPLTPRDSNAIYGRSGFFIHGKSVTNLKNSSNGCIVLDLIFRMKIIESGCHLLAVH